MRVRHKVNVVVSEDKNGQNKLFAPDDALAEVIADGFTEVSSGTVSIPALGSFTIPLGGLADARGLFVKVTGDATLAINGAAPTVLKRGSTGAAGAVGATARVFMEAAVSSAVVAAGASAVTLTYVLWGDPLP